MTDEITTRSGRRFTILRSGPRAVSKAAPARRWAIIKGVRKPEPKDAPVTRGEVKRELMKALRAMPAADLRKMEKALAAGEAIFRADLSPADEAAARQDAEAIDRFLDALDPDTRRAVEAYRELAEAGTEQGPEARASLVQSSSPRSRERIARRDIAHHSSRDTGGGTLGVLIERQDGTVERHGGGKLGLHERGKLKKGERASFDDVFDAPAWTGTRYEDRRQ
jgi:hypothetical protein